VTLAPRRRRLPFWRIPADLIGMFEIVESTATQLPSVRANRLQFVRSAPASLWPYERRFAG